MSTLNTIKYLYYLFYVIMVYMAFYKFTNCSKHCWYFYTMQFSLSVCLPYIYTILQTKIFKELMAVYPAKHSPLHFIHDKLIDCFLEQGLHSAEKYITFWLDWGSKSESVFPFTNKFEYNWKERDLNEAINGE